VLSASSERSPAAWSDRAGAGPPARVPRAAEPRPPRVPV